VARPRRPADVRVTEHTNIRWTKLEKSVVVRDAAAACLSVSEYVRRRALGIRVVSRTDETAIAELRRLGGLQKSLALKCSAEKEQYDAILQEIIAAIRRLG
jgi:hypothetical protein